MDWEQLKQHLGKGYDFFGRVGVSDSSQLKRVAIHPIAQMSVNLALRALSLGEKGRLVILMPNRLNCAKWIASLCTIGIMKQDYERGVGIAKFSRGQKLLVSRCVVEYLEEEYDSNYNRWYMWVRCRDGASNRIPLDRTLAFQPITSERPLSSIKTVSDAVTSAQHVDNPIDGILRIHTMGNKSIFKANIILTSRIGETVDFIRENQINSSPIIDLFLWGKLNFEGNASIIGPQNIQANPCCLVSPDLIGALHYICDNPKTTKGLIIDGAQDYSNDLPVLDEILDRKVPIIIIADILEIEHIQYFIDRDFRIWQWNKESIVQTGGIEEARKSPFSNFNESLANYCNQKVDIVFCEHTILETIVKETIELDKLIPHDNYALDIDYGKLIQIINELSRLLRIPDTSWHTNYIQKLQLLFEQFKSQKLWLSDQAIRIVNTTINELTRLIEDPFNCENHKPARFLELIEKQSLSDQVAIIVAKPNEVELTKQYWQNKWGDKQFTNIHFLTASDLVGQSMSFIPDHVVICGWLGRDKMSHLLHSYSTPHITILMYPFETEWFRSATSNWRRRDEFNTRARDFSDIFRLSENDLKLIEHHPEASVEVPAKEEFNIADFELKMKMSRYQSYISSAGSRDEVLKAKLVVFAGEKFSFLTESHHLPVVTEVFREEGYEGEIPRKDVSQLHLGDYILFQESNRDIIREIADKGLAKNGQSDMRKIAGLWRDVLRESYRKMSGNIGEFIDLLQNSGCQRSAQTIRNWLFDDDQIGPGRSLDLDLIARILSSKELKQKMVDVKTAISVVRGAHLQASSYIRNKLLSKLPEILSAGKGSGNASGVVLLNLDEFGQVEILRIEEIANDWQEIPTNTVNCLLVEEE